MKNRKVLLIIQDDGYPADTRARNEVKTLMSAGYQVSVICPRFGRERLAEVADGVNIYRFPSSRRAQGYVSYLFEYGYSLAAIFLLSLLVFVRRGFDVIQAHNPPDVLFLVAAFYKPLGKKFIFDHNDLAPEIYQSRFKKSSGPTLRLLRLLEKMSARLADAVLVVHPEAPARHLRANGIPPSKVFVAINAPDLDRFRALRPNGRTPGRQDGTTLGYVGHLGPQDGLDYLLRSVRHLAYELGRENFHCLVVGDGDALAALKEMARELGVDRFVTFTGRLPWNEAMELLSTVDICVDPSPENPINLKTMTVKSMEYMALGKPVVAYDLPGVRNATLGASLRARANDEGDFALNIARLLDDPGLRESLGKKGRERVEGELSWEQSARPMLEAYEMVFAKGR